MGQRVLVLILGIVFAGFTYSAGTFHTLLPTRAAVESVASCQEAPNVTEADPMLCHAASGEWKAVAYSGWPIFATIMILMGSALPLLRYSGYLKWASSSLRGHLTMLPLLFGVPMTLLGLHLNFVEGTLTFDWAIRVVMYTLGLALLAGGGMWYTFTQSLIRRRSRVR